MAVTIILIVIGIALCALSVVFALYQEKPEYLLGIILGLVVITFGCSFTYVPSGCVGIRTINGQISDKATQSGFNWHTPFFEKIHIINCKQQEKNLGATKIWSETSERTEIYCENVVVDYQINVDYASWIWINVEEWDTNLVKQTSIESGIKTATKMFNDTDVTDRSKIEKAAKECIQKSLNEKYENQIVDVISVTIGNMNFSDAYNEAIEKKTQAKLSAETVEYENKKKTQQIEAEAEQKKIQAEAEAEAEKIKAQARADAIRIEADAEAEANKKIAESLTPELINKLRIDKWNGDIPLVTGSSGTIIDIGEVIQDGSKEQENSQD